MNTNVWEEASEFLLSMGIPLSEQSPEYLAEIAYRIGYADAVRNYAIWKNGELLVGVMARPLNTVLAEKKAGQVPLRY